MTREEFEKIMNWRKGKTFSETTTETMLMWMELIANRGRMFMLSYYLEVLLRFPILLLAMVYTNAILLFDRLIMRKYDPFWWVLFYNRTLHFGNKVEVWVAYPLLKHFMDRL